MFSKIKNWYIERKINKLGRHPLFHETQNEIEMTIGNFGKGPSRRDFNFAIGNGVTFKREIKNVDLSIDETGNISIKGDGFSKVIKREEIRFTNLRIIPSFIVDDELEVKITNGKGWLEIPLKTGESVHIWFDAIENRKTKAGA